MDSRFRGNDGPNRNQFLTNFRLISAQEQHLLCVTRCPHLLRRPSRIGVEGRVVGETLDTPVCHIHYVNLVVQIADAVEGQVFTVRRPCRAKVIGRMGRQPVQPGAVRIDYVDLPVPITFGRESQSVPIGRPRRGPYPRPGRSSASYARCRRHSSRRCRSSDRGRSCTQS